MRAAPVRSSYGAAGPPPAAPPPQSTLPFDYTAVLPFRGQPGRIVQDVISISADSDFVAQGISYGFQPAPGNGIVGLPANTTLEGLRLGSFPLEAWLAGIRLNPRQLTRTLTADEPPQLDLTAPVAQAFVQAIAPTQVRFLFNAIDTSSGRELQDQPVNNIAALGDAIGRRPFRHFPQPFFLSRNATVRVQATEESADTAGDLFVVLFGYKLGIQGCAQPAVAGPPGARVIPFDYVARVPLSGIAGRRVEREVILDTTGGFRVTYLGYAVNSEPDTVTVTPGSIVRVNGSSGLAGLSLTSLPLSAWLDGVRLRPGVLGDALNEDRTGLTADDIPPPRLHEIFQRLNRPEDTFFRYEITDGGTGRELQNRAILNIAGLGSADGRRPFKKLSRPLEFGSRSTIKVAVEEVSGRGDLYLVFQGYRNDNRSGGWR